MIKCTLKEFLASKGLTTYWLMKNANISQKALYDLANMKTKGVYFETLEKICITLECAIDDILKIAKD